MFCFLPLTLAVYYLCPVRWRNLSLMLASLLFYFWGERLYAVIMIVSTLVDYTHGRIVAHCKEAGNDRGARMAVASSVILNLGILFFFKYWDFLAASLNGIGLKFIPVLGIHLPIGISFFTFQTMSYTIDVYRGDAEPQKSLLNFGTFVTLFPQLVAGPIIRYKDLGDQINERHETFDRFEKGITIFVIGLSKKLLLANNLGQLWDIAKGSIGSLSVAGAWLGVLAYSFQIYFDFSGYSDMAAGLGRMFGFEFPVNFNYPYISESITAFWRRWHISLSTWFREYLYIPLGGNRKGSGRWYFNIFTVWAATGLWHGASWNYLFWGLYFCIILIIEKAFLLKALEKAPKFVRHVSTLFLIMIGWTIFGLEDLSMLVAYLRTMFGLSHKAFSNAAFLYYAGQYLPILLIAAIGSTPAPAKCFGRLKERNAAILKTVLIALGLIVCTAYMVAGTYNPFLYFRF